MSLGYHFMLTSFDDIESKRQGENNHAFSNKQIELLVLILNVEANIFWSKFFA